MSRQTYSVEQIIIKLRQIEVQCGQGKTVAEAARLVPPPRIVPSGELVEMVQ
jgi:hypothetical protein